MNSSFHLLECFDDEIDNLDITKNYIYVLRLVEERYYVGRTGNILRRIEEHFTGQGAIYTIAYKPLKVIEVIEELSNEDERNKTLEIMDKYGWEKVRGAGWCSLNICKPRLESVKRKCIEHKDIVLDEKDLEMNRLYCCENMSIMEIGENLKISPGSIARRLELFNIIKRKQLARGYYEYLDSELYKQNIILSNERRENNKNNKNNKSNVKRSKYVVKDKKVKTLNNNYAKDLKERIREKILNCK